MENNILNAYLLSYISLILNLNKELINKYKSFRFSNRFKNKHTKVNYSIKLEIVIIYFLKNARYRVVI